MAFRCFSAYCDWTAGRRHNFRSGAPCPIGSTETRVPIRDLPDITSRGHRDRVRMSNFRIRPLTILLIVVGLACIAGGVVYFTTTAHDLPAFVPGHDAHSTTHHIKHGIAMIMLALAALGAAWFTTAPDRSESKLGPRRTTAALPPPTGARSGDLVGLVLLRVRPC
jgi:hypothetical protein